MSAPFIALAALAVALQTTLAVSNPRGAFVSPESLSLPPFKLTPPSISSRSKTALPSTVRRRRHVVPGWPRLRMPVVAGAEVAPTAGDALKRHLPRHRPKPAHVTLAQLLELLRARKPRSEASHARSGATESELEPSWVLPGPALSFAESGVGIPHADVPLPPLLAGEWRTSMRAAQARIDVAEGTVEAEYEDLVRTARDLFIELLADQARLARIDKALAELEQLQLVKARRGAPGEPGVWASVDSSSWRTRRAELASEAHDTAARLAVLIGNPLSQPKALGEFKPLGLSTESRETWPDAEGAQPDLGARARAELARAIPRLVDRRAILENYERDVTGQIAELRETSEDAVDNGEAEFHDLADAIRVRVEVDLARIDLVESVMHAEVAVLAASGRIDAMEGR